MNRFIYFFLVKWKRLKEESTTVFWPGVCVSATEMKSGIHRPARMIIVLDYSVVLVLFVKVLSVSF